MHNRRILHPTEDLGSKYYFEKCEVGYLYEKWLNLFIENGIKFEKEPQIIRFTNYKIHTPFTYKFNFNFPLLHISDSDIKKCECVHKEDYKLFVDLFLTEGCEEELNYALRTDKDFFWGKNFIKNPKYSANYGEISYNVKPWVDYITFQGYRVILQFRFDKYLQTEGRKNKLQKIKELYET